MEWHKVESTVMPEEIDTTSSKIYNYVRRNIEETTVESEGETVIMYSYEECKILKEAWGMYDELEQTKADIDYLKMITEDL